MKCSRCPKEFEDGTHNIVLDLGENTRATVPFDSKLMLEHFRGLCPECLQKAFQEYFDDLNPSQQKFMRDMLTKTAVSMIKTTTAKSSDCEADIVLIDDVTEEKEG